MPSIVKTQHPDYSSMRGKWQRCRDVSGGQDTIHGAGVRYLPELTDQTSAEYTNYKNRTPFYNATYRTIAGLQGMLFRKPPKVTAPDNVVEMCKDVTMSGVPLHIFALNVVEEALTVGRVGVFVDYPVVDTSTMTAADAVLLNLRPLMKMYKTESVINWKNKRVNNSTVLSMVVLQEEAPVPKNEFEDNCVTQYRVLDLFNDPVSNATLYRVRVFQVSDKDEDVLIETSFPKINNQHPDYIPFYFVGVDDVTSEVDEPPLIDLVDMNLMHYRVSADYEHGCHFTGLPTPVISGFTAEDPNQKFYIGSMTAWVFPRSDAKAFYLEFTGEGLNSLKDNLARKEQQMAILGARMLEAQVRAVESANTASIHRGGEQSMLASIAQSTSIGLSKALDTFCKFLGLDVEAKIELNKDFFPAPMDSLMITALIAAWQNRAISYDTLFENLKRGELMKPEQTVEQEQKDMERNKPVSTAGTIPNQDGRPIAHPTQRQLQTP